VLTFHSALARARLRVPFRQAFAVHLVNKAPMEHPDIREPVI
jgi:hypothetical protein